MKIDSTYGKAYLPKAFFSNISKKTFDGSTLNINEKISHSWMVRFYKLFEAVSDWLSVYKGLAIDAPTLINAWSNSAEISNAPFAASSGRLKGSKSLAFLKLLDKTLSDSDLSVIYSAVSKVLKTWDEWYLDTVAFQVDEVVSNFAPIQITNAKIFTDDSYYAYGTDPSITLPQFQHDVLKTIYIVEHQVKRDESFEINRIQPSTIKAPTDVLKTKAGVDLTGPVTLESLQAFIDAKKSGTPVNIKGFSGAGAVLNKADEAEQERKAKSVIDDPSVTPILDWLRGE